MEIIRKFLVLVFAFFIGVIGSAFAQTKLAADSSDAVNDNCSAFLGVWVGRWEHGDYRLMRLQVLEVSANCLAKGAYGADLGEAIPYEGAEIKDGKMYWLCNKTNAGVCVFESHGDTLWASYRDTQGYMSNGVFKRLLR